MGRPATPSFMFYYETQVEGRGRNKDMALEAHGVDLKYLLGWIRGEVVEQTEPTVIETYDGWYVATSKLVFERKQGKVYRR